jgi:hypothetical protein
MRFHDSLTLPWDCRVTHNSDKVFQGLRRRMSPQRIAMDPQENVPQKVHETCLGDINQSNPHLTQHDHKLNRFLTDTDPISK